MTILNHSHRRWRPGETIDVADESDIRAWARKLCVTPSELREMIEEVGDRSARIATEFGIPLACLGRQGRA